MRTYEALQPRRTCGHLIADTLSKPLERSVSIDKMKDVMIAKQETAPSKSAPVGGELQWRHKDV